jgi:hypothetical protein
VFTKKYDKDPGFRVNMSAIFLICDGGTSSENSAKLIDAGSIGLSGVDSVSLIFGFFLASRIAPWRRGIGDAAVDHAGFRQETGVPSVPVILNLTTSKGLPRPQVGRLGAAVRVAGEPPKGALALGSEEARRRGHGLAP